MGEWTLTRWTKL